MDLEDLDSDDEEIAYYASKLGLKDKDTTKKFEAKAVEEDGLD